jgi:hypothetical protein
MPGRITRLTREFDQNVGQNSATFAQCKKVDKIRAQGISSEKISVILLRIDCHRLASRPLRSQKLCCGSGLMGVPSNCPDGYSDSFARSVGIDSALSFATVISVFLSLPQRNAMRVPARETALKWFAEKSCLKVGQKGTGFALDTF